MMDRMVLNMRCLLFILALYVHCGLSGEFEAHVGRTRHSQRLRRQSKAARPVLKVTDYHLKCSVVSRYAITTVQSSVWNQLAITKEAAFEVDLPSSAFISNFTITSNGKVYVAQVKERAAARKIYDAAKKQGKTAGLVATKERETEKFRVAVSVPSGTRVSFSLSYEELLPRRLGRYELRLGLRPGQPVQNLTVDVGIAERTGISFIKVLPLKTSKLISNTANGDKDPPASTRVERSACCALIHYSPSLQQQTSLSSNGLNADFVVQYDVDLRDLMGDVQVFDGYFVHYFAPRGLPVVPKDVIFVIDVSGSMIGTKIKQTKQAMGTILGDLREGDHFNIITFSDKVLTWRRGRTVRATRQNVRDAKDFVKNIIAEGWTNINAALLSAAQLVNPASSSTSGLSSAHRVPLVIFLTDGEATIGVTAGDTILNNAKRALGSASLFGLAFGDDADFLLLKRLALDNRGVARMVYEDADAALQLKGFYDEVASPLLSDVQLAYLDDQAYDVTRSLFPNYFQGSELVVTGRVKPGVKDLKVAVTATDSKQRVRVENDVLIAQSLANETEDLLDCLTEIEGISNFVHRLWAYYTIKELLLAKLNSTDPAMQRLLTDKATNLSLKYNFVTPVTSLVVVKPDADEAPPTAATTTAAKHSTTTTSTAATTTTTKAPPTAARISTKKHKVLSGPKPNKTKSDLGSPKPSTPRQATNTSRPRKNPTPPSTAKSMVPSTAKKPSPTPSSGDIKTAPAPFVGKKTTPSQNDSKTGPAPPVGRISTPLLNSMKTAAPPAPGKLSTPQPSTVKATPPSAPSPSSPPPTSSSTEAPVTSVRPEPGTTATERPAVPTFGTVRAGAAPMRPTLPSLEVENSTVSSSDVPRPDVADAVLSPPGSPPPLPPPFDENDTNASLDRDLTVNMVPVTFAPMPGVTDGSKLWEAAGLLDVSTSIQIQRKDLDATYDYDYDLNYDAWDGAAETESFGPPAGLSTVNIFSSSVDGDPHFVVQLPKLQQNLCFTVDGRADDVLRLLEDPEKGIIVDGHLMGAPSKHGVEQRSRTYFDQIVVSRSVGSSGGVMITISLDAVVVEGEGRETLPVDQQASITRQGVTVTTDSHRGCWIELAEDMRFLFLFHHYKHPSYLQMAHLGFYITHGQGFSASTQGLLGQFQHADLSITEIRHHLDAGAHGANREEVLARGVLRWGSEHLPVILQDKTLKDTIGRRHLDQCWVVPKGEIQRLLGHSYQSYVVDHA